MANTYDLTQTGSEVQAILNDANNIKGAGAQTTLTTDYILLKDTNGQYHKILKDSFTEACRNVLAGLLVNNDKGTTISQIAAVASGDFGSVTPANLASVLGVKKTVVLATAGQTIELVRGSIFTASQSANGILDFIKPGYNEEYTVVAKMGTGNTPYTLTFDSSTRNTTLTYIGGGGYLTLMQLV